MSDINTVRPVEITRNESVRFQIPLKIDFLPESDWHFNLISFLGRTLPLHVRERLFDRISETLLVSLPVFAVDKKTLDNIFCSGSMEIGIKRKKFPGSQETLEVSIEFYGHEALINLSAPRTIFSLTFYKANEVERFPRTPEWNEGQVPLKFLTGNQKPLASTFVMVRATVPVKTTQQHCFLNTGYGDEVGVERRGPTAVNLIIENQQSYSSL